MMRFKFIISLLIFIIPMSELIAVQPKFTLRPLTDTALNLPNNKNRIIQYQVTNNLRVPRSLAMNAITGVSLVKDRPNACVDIFNLNSKESCILNLLVHGNLYKRGIEIEPRICTNGSSGFECSQPSPQDTMSVTVVPPAIVAAVGTNSSTHVPLIVQSTTGGESWTIPSTVIPDNCESVYLNSASCTGSGATAMCIAVGYAVNNSASTPYNQPFIVQSINGGTSWTNVTVANMPTHGSFNSASCSIYNGENVCVAAGENITSLSPTVYSLPLIVQSTNNGQTWDVMDIEGANALIPGQNSAGSVSCYGEICLAIAYPSQQNYIIVGSEYDSWSLMPLQTDIDVKLVGGSCTAYACVGIGYNPQSSNQDVTVTSVQNSGGNPSGASYVVQLSSNYFKNGNIQNSAFVSCTGQSSEAVCAAIGTIDNSQIVQSTDGGRSWEYQTISGAPLSYVLLGVSCTPANAPYSSCFVVGQNLSNSQPFIAQSIAGGVWGVATIPTYPSNAYFSAINCSSSSTTDIVCVATGGYGSKDSPTNQPIVAIFTPNEDGVTAWADATSNISGLPAGYLYANAVTGG